MPWDLIIIKNHIHLFLIDEQIDIINIEIDRLERNKKRTGSIQRVNKTYALINQLKTLKKKLIEETIQSYFVIIWL